MGFPDQCCVFYASADCDESKEITIQVPKVIMEEVEITYQVPAMETKTRTVQRPKTIM